jgi:hypothetical protein
MPRDGKLGRPILPLLVTAPYLLPPVLVVLVVAHYFPRCPVWLWAGCFTYFAAALVGFTPYLLVSELCFYAMSRLSFPHSLSVHSWITHTSLLAVIVLCFWRTWTAWPKKGRDSDGQSAPWWGYVIGSVAALGIFSFIAYWLNFKD